ncbi:MAG TPA: dihydrofolate reductase [Chitinophagales bacterium]|nr:dihydrofolate reductase [Bacteroidota bacterium]HPR28667.1 dihydrofolate reductase [Chitinophagales bacterium]HQU75956.1 dihydrofolate reductase [Chitinophagales bacterium]
MNLSIIVAVSENGVIGLNGDMPWKKLPSDLKFFKETTMGHWCILGRKTYDALGGKVLPGRRFIIITRDTAYQSADSLVVHSVFEAMHHPAIADEKQVFVLGGGDIYRQLRPYCNTIYLTRIHASFDGDTYFNTPDEEEWILAERVSVQQDEYNPYDHDFLTYKRKGSDTGKV